MPISFESVDTLSAYLDSGEAFDLNAMRAALRTLVTRAVAADRKIANLQSEVEALRATEVNALRAKATAPT